MTAFMKEKFCLRDGAGGILVTDSLKFQDIFFDEKYIQMRPPATGYLASTTEEASKKCLVQVQLTWTNSKGQKFDIGAPKSMTLG